MPLWPGAMGVRVQTLDHHAGARKGALLAPRTQGRRHAAVSPRRRAQGCRHGCLCGGGHRRRPLRSPRRLGRGADRRHIPAHPTVTSPFLPIPPHTSPYNIPPQISPHLPALSDSNVSPHLISSISATPSDSSQRLRCGDGCEQASSPRSLRASRSRRRSPPAAPPPSSPSPPAAH